MSSLLKVMSLFFMDLFKPVWTVGMLSRNTEERGLSLTLYHVCHPGRGNEGSVDYQCLIDKEI